MDACSSAENDAPKVDAAEKDEVYNLVHSLVNRMAVSGQATRRHSATRNPNELRVKCEYRGEKRSFNIQRPVSLHSLSDQLRRMYGRQLNVYFSQGEGEVIIAVRSQDALDKAVQMTDRNGQRSLRLILSRHEAGVTHSLHPDNHSGAFTSKVEEVAYSESCCSSCGASNPRLAASIGGSSASSGVQELALDDWRGSARTPAAPLNWRQGACIGAGAFGQVYIAYDMDTGRELAMKKIPYSKTDHSSKKNVAGLEFELNHLGTLRHPRIVQYLGVVRKDNNILIFMEYMTGLSVKDFMAKMGRPLSQQLARKFTGQVLEGLAYLHRFDIVHRDIKSANILKDSLGNVKIGDFGSGKRLQSIASERGNFQGTVHYTAPEVLLGKNRYGRKADVWAVGVTLVEMLMGQVPFHGLDSFAAMYHIAYEEHEYELPEDVDDSTRELVTTMLTRTPGDRPMAQDVLSKFFK